MRRQSSSSSSVLPAPARGCAPRPFPTHVDVDADAAISSIIVSTSRMRRHVAQHRRARRSSRHAARIGSAAFLFPVARIEPSSGRAPSITKDSQTASVAMCWVSAVSTGGRLGRDGGLSYAPHGGHSRSRLGDAHDLHEERGAAAPRARRRGGGRRLRAAVRRGRGALARDGAPPRLRLRDPSHARQAPAGRRADPPRGGLARRGGRVGALPRRAPGDAAGHAR